MLPVATGRKGTFPIACSINVGFGVGLAEWGSKSTFALQDSESHMSALGHSRHSRHPGVRFAPRADILARKDRRRRPRRKDAPDTRRNHYGVAGAIGHARGARTPRRQQGRGETCDQRAATVGHHTPIMTSDALMTAHASSPVLDDAAFGDTAACLPVWGAGARRPPPLSLRQLTRRTVPIASTS